MERPPVAMFDQSMISNLIYRMTYLVCVNVKNNLSFLFRWYGLVYILFIVYN